MRVDHNFGKGDSLFARYTIEDSDILSQLIAQLARTLIVVWSVALAMPECPQSIGGRRVPRKGIDQPDFV